MANGSQANETSPYVELERAAWAALGASTDQPLSEQEVERVGHGVTPDQLVAVGRDVECQALARAVKWHAERRILLNGRRTVVFP